MNVVCPSKPAWLTFDQIDLPDSGRPYNATDVGALIKSIRTIGLMIPLTVIERGGRYLLIAGRHRLEALRVIGAEGVPVRVVDFDDIEARLWTISENLHRTELHPVHRAEQIAEFARLVMQRQESRKDGAPPESPEGDKPVQVGHLSKGGRGLEGGVSLAARELGISRQTVLRSQTIAALPDEVRARAVELGPSDGNQSALLRAAKAPTPEAQVETLERATDRPAQPSAKPLHNLQNLAAGELARWIKQTTPNARTHVIRMLRECAAILEDEMEAARGNG